MEFDMEEPVRVRVVFDDRNLLSESQRMEGLKRSWLLLKPGMVAISDIAHHLMKRFKLKRSCPDGLLLSMDDFVLPPFESTCILKDKDIIRVRKKCGTLVDVINAGNVQQYIRDSGVVERQLTHCSQELLAITEFQEDSGLHRRRHEKDSSLLNENRIHTRSPSSEKTKSKRKRKHSDNASDSKGKKLKFSNSEIPTVSTEVDEDILSGRKGGSSHREKHSNRDGRSNACSISQPEDTVEKMHSHVPKEAKRKKSKQNIPEKSIIATENADSVEQNKSYEKGESSQKSLRRKHKTSIKHGNSVVPIDSMLEHTTSKLPSSVPTEERRAKPEENNACDPHANGSPTKVQSRGARRKKAKREWLRRIISQNNEDTQTDHHPPNDTHKKSIEHQEKVLTSEMQEEIVPIVVRPGHIRFEPLDEEQSLCQSQVARDTVQWNGTTSKKKGQKWGRENNFGKSNDANHCKDQYNRNSDDAVGSKNNGKNIGEGWKDNGKPIAEGWKSNGKSDAGVWRSNGKSITEGFEKDSAGGWKSNEKSISEAWPANEKSDAGVKNKEKSIVEGNSDRCIDYESLFPLTQLPQKGDLLVYRLVELSSSWCPEVSPFRVGKVSFYDPISLRIILVPVPEYPIFCHEDEDEESMDQVNVPAYKEDGSLEVSYPSLVDVRLFKANDGKASTAEHDGKETITTEATLPNNLDQALANENGKEIGVTPPTDGQSAWEQIRQAISEKKAQLQKNNGNDNWDECTPRKHTATTSWSYRALRGSAMGPTLAFLRGNNVLDPTS